MGTAEAGEDFVAHYGVLGMKWGVRKDRLKGRSSQPQAVKTKTTPGKKVQTSGGQNQPASEDAKRVARLKQRAKASTTDSLSTKELKDLTERMNLELQYNKLSEGNKSKGQAFVEKQLRSMSQQTISQLFQYAYKEGLSVLMKKLAKYM